MSYRRRPVSRKKKEKVKEKSNHQQKKVPSHWVKIAQAIGACVAVLAIINLGFQCILYIKTGNYYGHTNYWHQPVGTLLIAAILITLIAICAFKVAERFISKKKKGTN